MNMVKVGQIGTLVNCKHSWNNGKKVKITKIGYHPDVHYTCVAVKPIEDEPNIFIIGTKNFKA